LCALPNIRVTKSRRMRWTWYVACMGELRDEYKIVVGKHKRRRPLERPSYRWHDNIAMNLRKRVGSFRLDSSGSG
jgi:hypothetical protein